MEVRGLERFPVLFLGACVDFDMIGREDFPNTCSVGVNIKTERVSFHDPMQWPLRPSVVC